MYRSVQFDSSSRHALWGPPWELQRASRDPSSSRGSCSALAPQGRHPLLRYEMRPGWSRIPPLDQEPFGDQCSAAEIVGRGVLAGLAGTVMTAFQKLVEMPLTGRDDS